MKLPAIQFYPGDWKRDPGVQALSFHDRGVWLEIICLMHESEQRGVLLLGGNPMPDEALARLLGLDNQILTTTLTTLLTYGVASRDPETGALINRRMVRDEELRQIRAESGKKGGNPALKPVLLNQISTTPVNQISTTHLKQISTPSSSSSSSISLEESGASTTHARFKKPTAAEVADYGQTLTPPFFEAERFVDYYESKGWSVGKGSMKNWRAAVRMWNAKNKASATPRLIFEKPSNRPLYD